MSNLLEKWTTIASLAAAGMRWGSGALLCALLLCAVSQAHAHGFNANTVNIVHMENGKYRVVIRYSHVEVGEYREAHVDFEKESEAVDVFRKLVQGADFFLGDVPKSLHFHNPPVKNSPY